MITQAQQKKTGTEFSSVNHMDRASNKDIAHPRIITVTSGKGGVGKSTICVNLGIALSNLGNKVLLLDGDLGLANLNVLMGIIPEYSIYDVVRARKTLDEVVISTNYGIDIIAGANGVSQLADIGDVERELFLKQVEGLNGYDIVIIDTGAGIGSNVINFALASDEVIVVTTPEPTSITDAYAMIKSIIIHNPKKILRLIVNRTLSSLEARRVTDRIKTISSRFLNTSVSSLGFVIEEDFVRKSVRSQRPLLVSYPGSRSASCLTHLSAELMTEKNKPNAGGLQSFFRNILGKNKKNAIGLFQ